VYLFGATELYMYCRHIESSALLSYCKAAGDHDIHHLNEHQTHQEEFSEF